MLRKVKAIIGLAVIAAAGGFFAAFSGVDYEAAFGPSIGAFASAGVAFMVKESYPRIAAYLSDAFGVSVPEQDQ